MRVVISFCSIEEIEILFLINICPLDRSIAPTFIAMYSCVRNSPAEPFDILRKRINSLLELRSNPSAMFEGTETAERHNWSFKPKSLQLAKDWYILTASSKLSFHTTKSSNLSILDITNPDEKMEVKYKSWEKGKKEKGERTCSDSLLPFPFFLFPLKFKNQTT